jgi:hypothetical protein
MSTFTTKNLIIAGLYTAFLIVAQLALSAIAGIEIVTVLLLSFCYIRGVKQGVVLSTAFSLIRCFVFGFTPNVLVLYILYYNLFALVTGLVGYCFKNKYTILGHVFAVLVVECLTVCFTLLDCVITPAMYGFTLKATKAYFFASLPVVTTQVINVFATTILLFFPVSKVLSQIK